MIWLGLTAAKSYAKIGLSAQVLSRGMALGTREILARFQPDRFNSDILHMENQHEQIKGYRDLSQEEIDLMNSIKDKEEDLGALWREISSHPGVDKRHLALAKTHFETAFMFFVKSIAKPEDRF